jgi:SsrA-binding protein
MAKAKSKSVRSTVNRRATFDYALMEEFEAGIQLLGSEIKAIREGRVNLTESYGVMRKGELIVRNMQIGAYSHSSSFVHEERRDRKLLLHRTELNKIAKKLKESGTTVVILRMYINEQGRAKVAIALGKGKKNYDKRATIKDRENKRKLDRLKGM